MTFLALVCRAKILHFLPSDLVAQVDGRGVWRDFFVHKRGSEKGRLTLYINTTHTKHAFVGVVVVCSL
jgi:hypothetical protein